MGKIVFWLVVFFIALLALRLVNAASNRGARGKSSADARKAQDTAMTRCVNCGVYLPRADAVDGPRGPLCGDPQCLPRDTGSRS